MMHYERVSTDLTQAENGMPQGMLNQLCGKPVQEKEEISA